MSKKPVSKKSTSEKVAVKKVAPKKVSAKKAAAKKVIAKKPAGKKGASAKVMAAKVLSAASTPITIKGILAIDTDGIGDHHKDKSAKNETSARLDSNGRFVELSDPSGIDYLNADVNEYAVAPKNLAAVNGGPIHVGDTATVTFKSGKTHSAPVGDFGPKNKAGEFSLIAIQNMGVQVIFTKSGPVPTLDGPNASDIPVTVQFFPGTAP